jgi:hypothetical protein
MDRQQTRSDERDNKRVFAWGATAATVVFLGAVTAWGPFRVDHGENRRQRLIRSHLGGERGRHSSRRLRDVVRAAAAARHAIGHGRTDAPRTGAVHRQADRTGARRRHPWHLYVRTGPVRGRIAARGPARERLEKRLSAWNFCRERCLPHCGRRSCGTDGELCP